MRSRVFSLSFQVISIFPLGLFHFPRDSPFPLFSLAGILSPCPHSHPLSAHTRTHTHTHTHIHIYRVNVHYMVSAFYCGIIRVCESLVNFRGCLGQPPPRSRTSIHTNARTHAHTHKKVYFTKADILVWPKILFLVLIFRVFSLEEKNLEFQIGQKRRKKN